MLDVDKLKNELKDGISNIIVPAIEEITKLGYPQQGTQGDEMAKNVADTFDDLVSDALAEIIANAIDCYIKNIDITGTIITTGSPVTQTASIFSTQTPITNGKVPNTLGVS